MNRAQFPYDYIPDKDVGRPLFNAELYFGIPDLDPEIPANQIDVYGKQEDGTSVLLPQPIETGAGGVPLYNGSPIELLVDELFYSFKALSRNGSQIYYAENVAAVLTADAIPAILQNAVRSIDNIADLQATTPSFDGQQFSVYEYADGTGVGGGMFIAVAGSTSENLVTTFDGPTGWYYKRIDYDFLTPEMGGCTSYPADDSSKIELVQSLGEKVIYRENYGFSGEINFIGECEFINGAKLTAISEAKLISDGDLNAVNLFVDFDDNAVDLCGIYLKSGTHRISMPMITNIRGDGRGGYGIKINVEGCDTEIRTAYFQNITDSRDGGISGDEGFCGGIYITPNSGSTMTSQGSRIVIRNVYGENIYTTTADRVTENTTDYDADLIRVFVNDGPSINYIDTVYVDIAGVVSTEVQKRAVKISGIGDSVVRDVSANGDRALTQMSDAVFVADSRKATVENIKAFGKFDNVVKLDGAAFDAEYKVNNLGMTSSQNGVGCLIQGTDIKVLSGTNFSAQSQCERLFRLSNVDSCNLKNLCYEASTTSINPLIDVQNCDSIVIDANIAASFSGATGQVVYAQNSNTVHLKGIYKANFGGANGQAIRWATVTKMRLDCEIESNKYALFADGSNGNIVGDINNITQTSNSQAISLTNCDSMDLNIKSFTGDYTGAAMTSGVIALSGCDDFTVTGRFTMLGMTSAGNDRGLIFTSCTGGLVNVQTIGTAASDGEMLRFVTCSKVKVVSRSNSTVPGNILAGNTDFSLESYGPAAFTNGAGAEVTVIQNVATW